MCVKRTEGEEEDEIEGRVQCGIRETKEKPGSVIYRKELNILMDWISTFPLSFTLNWYCLSLDLNYEGIKGHCIKKAK